MSKINPEQEQTAARLEAIVRPVLSLLERTDEATACKWWAAFNRKKWPLRGKPIEWDSLPDSLGPDRGARLDKFLVCITIMEAIKKKHGKQKCLAANAAYRD